MAFKRPSRSSVAFALGLLVIVAVTCFAHPICVDSTAPFVRSPSQFQKCPQYNGRPTCASPVQEASVVIEPTYDPTVPTQCRNVFRTIACAALDQWSGHLFRAEGSGDASAIPILCATSCQALYDTCNSSLIANSPFVNDSSSLTSMAAMFGTKEAFCSAFTDEDYCYQNVPYSVPPPQPFVPTFRLCVERVMSNSGPPKVNFQPVPGFPNLMMIGDLQGLIRIYEVDNMITGKAFRPTTTLLDIRSLVAYGGERGLLGVAMHKQFRTNGRLYVSFSCKGAAARIDCAVGDSIIDEYRVLDPSSPNQLQASKSTRRRIIRVNQPYPNHNGDQILFSPDPSDPHLYFMLGDGGGSGDRGDRAQPLKTLFGKVLRIDIDSTAQLGGEGTVPSDNPFVNVTGARGFIWANGLRNPWRCSFDRVTFVMYCGDVGQNTYEEINVISKGGNYGWSRLEGPMIFDPKRKIEGNQPINPILFYRHRELGGFASVTGGYVVRSNRDPRINGSYLFGDLGGPLFVAEESPSGSGQWVRSRIGIECARSSPWPCTRKIGGAYSFGEMLSGDILYADGTGSVWRFIEPTRCRPSSPPTPFVPCTAIARRKQCNGRFDCVFSRRKCRPRPPPPG